MSDEMLQEAPAVQETAKPVNARKPAASNAPARRKPTTVMVSLPPAPNTNLVKAAKEKFGDSLVLVRTEKGKVIENPVFGNGAVETLVLTALDSFTNGLGKTADLSALYTQRHYQEVVKVLPLLKVSSVRFRMEQSSALVNEFPLTFVLEQVAAKAGYIIKNRANGTQEKAKHQADQPVHSVTLK